MIDQLYYYFIKTKYSEFKTIDVEKMKVLHDKSIELGVTANTLSDVKKSAIEIGLLGEELSIGFRHVDNYILSNKFIIDSFIENESTLGASMKRLSGELLNI